MTTAVPMFVHGHSLQAGEALAPAARGASLFMLAIVAVVLAALAVGILSIFRRAKRGESPEHALLRELRDEEKNPQQNTDSPSGEGTTEKPDGWEKDPDWWKESPPGGKRREDS